MTGIWRWAIGFVVVLILLLGLLLFCTALFGLVAVEEFSPDTFELRQYSYRRIPWLNFPVSSTYLVEDVSSLRSYLLANQLLGGGATPVRWHVVQYQADGGSYQGQASTLLLLENSQLLDGLASGPPTQAEKLFWREFVLAARLGLYEALPGMVDLAEQNLSYPQFESRLHALVAERSLRAASIEQNAGNHEAAVKLIDAALARGAAESAELFRRRATSHDALGNNADAKADLAKAAALDRE